MAKEVMFVKSILEELGLGAMAGSQGVTVRCDNQGAISLTKNIGYSPRTKHIDIRHHFIRELVERKEINPTHISTEDNLADILTKGLGTIKHSKFSQEILVKFEGACQE